MGHNAVNAENIVILIIIIDYNIFIDYALFILLGRS